MGRFIRVYKLKFNGIYGLLNTVMISNNQFTQVHLNAKGEIRSLIFKQNLVSGINWKKFDFQGNKIGEITINLTKAESVENNDIKNWQENIKQKFKYPDREWFQKFGRVVDQLNKSIYNHKPVFDREYLRGWSYSFTKKTKNMSFFACMACRYELLILLIFNTRWSKPKLSKNYLFIKNTR